MMKHYFHKYLKTSLHFFVCGNYPSQACVLKEKKQNSFANKSLPICLKIKPHSTLCSQQHNSSE